MLWKVGDLIDVQVLEVQDGKPKLSRCDLVRSGILTLACALSCKCQKGHMVTSATTKCINDHDVVFLDPATCCQLSCSPQSNVCYTCLLAVHYIATLITQTLSKQDATYQHILSPNSPALSIALPFDQD